MTIIHSRNVLLQDIYVNSTSLSHAPARNTDGADTIYSDSIHFDRWTVDNGDDCISMKANSTNIQITNSTFYRGLGIAIGSIGQYNGVYERVENVTATGIVFQHVRNAAYFKTWTGDQVGYPPNGGGGGIGCERKLFYFQYFVHANPTLDAANFNFTDFTLNNNTGVFSIIQCTTFSGVTGDCNSSKFVLHDIHFTNIRGTVNTSTVASFKCSGDAPCYNIEINDVNLVKGDGTLASTYSCSHVENTTGFTC
jgi:galacturan 1,4-alpha-galacturonidase